MTRYYKYKRYPDFYIFRDMCSRTGNTLGFYVFRVDDHAIMYKSDSLEDCKDWIRSVYGDI